MITSVMMEMPGSDEWFMRQAMKESRKALVKGECTDGAGTRRSDIMTN